MTPTILTCAVTGNISSPDQTPYLPITPEEISASAIEAADAGAAVVHIHVRHPATGQPATDLSLYREVVETLRQERPGLVINLTTGPGARLAINPDAPLQPAKGTTLTVAEERIAHVVALRPDICSLDLNTMNSGDRVLINAPSIIRRMAAGIRAAGVVPEIECFDLGDLVLASDLISEGALEGPGLFSLVCGVSYGMPFSPQVMSLAQSLLPPAAQWTGFGIGRNTFSAVVQSYLLGGHVRTGLEDSIYLSRGELARSNAALVRKAASLIRDLGGEVADTVQARRILGLGATSLLV